MAPFVSSPLVRLLQQADKHLQSGDFQSALAASEQAMRKAPRHPDVLLMSGIVQLALGMPDRALPLLERVLSIDPRSGAALEHAGLAFLMLSRYAEAESMLSRASKLPGAPPSVFMRLGIALLELNRPAESLAHLQRAVSADPGDADALINLGRALASMNRSTEARTAFSSAMQAAPYRPEPAHNLGVMALQAGELAEAERCFRQALACEPAFVDARLNLGIVLRQLGRFDDAKAALRVALTYEAGSSVAYVEMGRTLALQGQHEDAIEHYRRALTLAPDSASAHEGLASVCLDVGRLPEAIEHLRSALQADAANSAASAALASALFQVGDLDAGQTAAERCIELDPQHAGAYGTLANVLTTRGDLAQAIAVLEAGYDATRSTPLLGMLAYLSRQACDWDRWQVLWREMEPMLDTDAALGSPFWLLCEPVTGERLLAYTRRWAQARFFASSSHPKPTEAADALEQRRIRIGYLSSDLHDHATAYLIADVIERHDRNRFEVFAYSHGPEDGSAMRSRMRAAFEHFVDISQQPDDVAAERIRSDRLDLLIDLKGYTLGDRLTIMARRPCRTQVSWLGYPGTTASDFIDYLIADPVVIPESAAGMYTEQIVRMPVCYQPNDRARIVADPLARREYGLPEASWVFCCFNQTYKITPDVFAAWMRLLVQVPDSVLWLLESNTIAATNLRRAVQTYGIPQDRLVFAPRRPNAEHLARYRVANLALDTFPYTSHTTMSDALWCGCPSIALCGTTFAARVSSSVVAAAGLPDLVVDNLEEYEALTLRLVNDTEYRADVRQRLVAARAGASLFDSERFARDLERAYVAMLPAR